MVCFCLLVCNPFRSNAQLTDNYSSFRNIGQKSYFRFHYDNDYFTKTDRYYSQGITMEYVYPSLKRNFLTKILWKPYPTAPQYGISFNLFGYTASRLNSDSILYGDRPFDANMSLKIFSLQSNEEQRQQLSAAFSIGVMGPAALGEEIQTHIHRWLHNKLPQGWQHQVHNDIIINYQLNYEKQLFAVENNFLVNTTAGIRAGTLNNKISGGVNFMAGRFNKRYGTAIHLKRKTEYYLYGQGSVNFIGYDASLQGGLFNRKSPYVIAPGDISRATLQADAGIIVNFKKLYLSYTQSFLSKEFRTGKYHRWGGVSIGVTL